MKNELERLSKRVEKLEAEIIGSKAALVCLKHVVLRNGGLTGEQWDSITSLMIGAYTAISERETNSTLKACFAQVADYIRHVNEMAEDDAPFLTVIDGGKAH